MNSSACINPIPYPEQKYLSRSAFLTSLRALNKNNSHVNSALNVFANKFISYTI